MYLLIQRTPDVPPKFNNYRFETFDQAVWKARESNHDYLIQREANGVMPGMPITYRIGPYELDWGPAGRPPKPARAAKG